MKNIFLDIDDQYLKNIQGSSDKNSFSKLVQVLREKIEAKAFILNKNVSMLQSFLNQLRLSGKLKILNTANFRNSDYYIWKNGEIDILDPQKDFLVSVLNNKEQGVKENIIFTNTIYSNNEFVYLIEDIRNPKNTNSYWTEIEIVKCDSTIDIENWIKKNVGMRKFERKLDDTKHDIHPYLDCASTLEIENKIKDKYKSDLYCSESRAYDLLQTAFGTPDKTELFNYDPKVKLFINFKETYPNTERQVYHGFHRVDRNDFLKEVQKEIQDQLIQLEKSRIRLYKQNQEYKPDESIDKNKQYESKLKEFKD
ncbi:MAG: hypothetical protein IPO06_04745 [Leptospiraceae bacterium]|nr:hypothetical protein [Leptospiraceae bacterium]